MIEYTKQSLTHHWLEHFIATEFIEGQTLRERIRQAPIKPREAIDIGIQVASALCATHTVGIVHRDVKPENIMLRRDGIVKVLDFGLAKLSRDLPAAPEDSEAPTQAFLNTEPGMVLGTVQYMSPEQARGLELDARTDIWSLGCVLYEMITRPYRRRFPLHRYSTILHHTRFLRLFLKRPSRFSTLKT